MVRLDIAESVAHVRLNRPEARNALNLAMCVELERVMSEIDASPDVRVVLISGEGPCFCAGADLSERQGKDAAWVRARRMAAFAAYAAIEACTRPVISLLHGAVVGSGGEIALASDFAVAATDVSFHYPEAHWGTIGATQRLQRVVGKRRAKELLFTNRKVEADEAVSLGLVMRLVEPGSLVAEGHSIAQRIAEAPPSAIALTKRAIDLGEGVDLERGIRIELAAIDQNLAGDAWQDGIARFNADTRPADGGTAR